MPQEVRIDQDVRFLTMVANFVGQALKLHHVVAEDRERLIDEQHRLAKELSTLKSPKTGARSWQGILGKSRAIKAVTERIEQVAQSNAPGADPRAKPAPARSWSPGDPRASRAQGKPFIRSTARPLPEG